MYFFSDANKISIYVYVQPRVKREQLYKCADCQLITGMASTYMCENKRTLKIDGNIRMTHSPVAFRKRVQIISKTRKVKLNLALEQ